MGRSRTLLDWLILDQGSGRPLYRQIYEQIRNAVISGRLPAGTSLPASRALASSLGVARITVLQAYDQLIAEGFLISRRGSGTRVTSLVGDEAGRQTLAAVYGKRADPTAFEPLQLPGSPPMSPAFRPGIPAFDAFPRLLWSRLLHRHGQRVDRSVMDYVHPGGYAPLRQALARYLMASRGVSCVPEQVVVVSSMRAATALVCGALLSREDRVVVEDPGYLTARRCLESAGMRIAPVPVDGDGIRAREIAERAPHARLAYVTPSHQWPTGVGLSIERRLELLAWAHRHEAWVLEDDYDSEFRFSEAPLTALHGLSGGERVIFLGTFAKVLAPSIRCAYLVVPKDLAPAFGELAFIGGHEPSLHVQGALSDFINEGYLARHIQQMRKLYRVRRDRVLEAFAALFGDRFRFRPAKGGLALVVDLADDLPAGEIERRADGHAVSAWSVADYYVEAKPPNALHLGFAAVRQAEVRPAAERLREAIADLL